MLKLLHGNQMSALSLGTFFFPTRNAHYCGLRLKNELLE